MSNIHKPWVEAYLRAAREIDGQKMPERIIAAREAVFGRLKDLEGNSDHHAERHEMQSALAALTNLEDETHIWPTAAIAPSSKESVAAILTRCKTSLIEDWLVGTKKTPALNHLHLSDEERTGHLPKLVDDLVVRLDTAKLPDQDSDAIASPAAIEHGKLRRTQGYSSGMLIHESRILQVAIFGTLHKNLSTLDFNLLLPDVMIIADEVDAQLTQTMEALQTPDLNRRQPETALCSETG
jgi:hypothetical protein